MADNQGSLSDGRSPTGRFGAGNPGRPVGAVGKTSRAAIVAVQALGSEALAVVRAKLAEGDFNAAKLVLSYCLPTSRAIELGCALSPNTIEQALADGAISPAEAATAATALEKLENVRSLHELEARILELEAALADRVR